MCPHCGFDVPVDGDGCCETCGADAVGEGVGKAIALRAALKRILHGLDAHRKDTYHSNYHHPSCALNDCDCLESFVKGVLGAHRDASEP
jgi:hypothetical protein